MSSTSVTISPAAVADMSAAQIKRIESAVRSVLALEPTNAAIVRAIRGAVAVKGMGYSGRGVAQVLAHFSNGATSTATVARLIQTGEALEGEWPNVGDAADAITASLYRVACKGKAADVTRAADLARAATNGDDALAAVDAVLAELRAADARAAITPPARQPQIASEREDDDADAPADSDGTDADAVAEAAPTSTRGLIVALTQRVTARGFTPDAVLAEAFDALALAWEAAMERTTVDA